MDLSISMSIDKLTKTLKDIRYSQLLEKIEDERTAHGEAYAKRYREIAQQFKEG